MHVMKAFLTEVLRLHPSVWLDMKFAVRDDVLPDGTKVGKNSPVAYFTKWMGRNPAKWKEPMRFDPERFIHNGQFAMPDQQLFPVFNAGKRKCLGENMAQIEMQIFLIYVLPCFTFKFEDDSIDVKPKDSLTLPIDGGLNVRIICN